MKIVKIEIVKRRQEHRKTVYKIVLVQQFGFWRFKTFCRCELNWPFDSYEQAHKWARREYKDVKTITAGQVR